MGGVSPLPSAAEAFLNNPEAIRNQAPAIPNIARFNIGRRVAAHHPILLLNHQLGLDMQQPNGLIEINQRLIALMDRIIEDAVQQQAP